MILSDDEMTVQQFDSYYLGKKKSRDGSNQCILNFANKFFKG